MFSTTESDAEIQAKFISIADELLTVVQRYHKAIHAMAEVNPTTGKSYGEGGLFSSAEGRKRLFESSEAHDQLLIVIEKVTPKPTAERKL